MPLITVCICTHNRAELLRELLESLKDQQDIDKASVLVVDNNCTDHTPAVVESFHDSIPGIRWVSETKPGLSNARNRGLEESDAPLIAYLDDDAVCEPGWIHGMLDPFQSAGADAVGGKIVPYWKKRKPWWATSSLYAFLSGNDHGAGIISNTSIDPYGGNMAYKTELLRGVGGFEANLGMVSVGGTNKTQFLGEETQLVAKLRDQGASIAYTGAATIRHLTDGPMSTYKGVRRRAVMMALTTVQISGPDLDERAIERQWVMYLLKMMICLMTLRPRRALAEHLFTVLNGTILREMLVGRQSRRHPAISFLGGIFSGAALAFRRLGS